MGSGSGGSGAGGGGGGRKVVGGGGQVEADKLGDFDRENINAYTGGTVEGGERFSHLNAEELNKMLYDDFTTLTPEGAKYRTMLNKSLDKVVDSPGKSYRIEKLHGLDKHGIDSYAQQFEPGKPHKFKGFLSTATNKDAGAFSYKDAGRGVRFKVSGKHGKNISSISEYGTAEAEKLFKSGSKFMVESRSWNASQNTWDVALKEI